jgi:hypothetical protein
MIEADRIVPIFTVTEQPWEVLSPYVKIREKEAWVKSC